MNLLYSRAGDDWWHFIRPMDTPKDVLAHIFTAPIFTAGNDTLYIKMDDK